MNSHRMLLGIVAALAIGGCATGYQKSGLTGGYSERKISNSAYVVSFGGNGYASKERVWYFWIYRCAELTSQNGYELLSLRQNTPAAGVPREGNLVPAIYDANGRGQFIKVRGSSAPMIITTPGTTITTWNSSGTVLMFHQPLPDEVLWAMSSQSILAELKPYVTSNGKAPAPSRSDLLKHAFTAHERIDFGDHMTIGAAGAFAGGTAPPGMQPRSPASVQSGVDFSRLLMFHAVYREHSLRTAETSGGRIVLAFTISPNGLVKDASVVSTTFIDRAFVERILNIVRQTDFGPLDVGDTRVSEFPISFSSKGSSGV
jgi:hypothetical protein